MESALALADFLKLSTDFPVIDVRTPTEFGNGHIPGDINMPLFAPSTTAYSSTACAAGCAVKIWHGSALSITMRPTHSRVAKGFRQTILNAFSDPTDLVVLDGYSGSGKTAILHVLAYQLRLESKSSYKLDENF